MSNKRNPNFYTSLSKKYLQNHETIELHSLGDAISVSVITAENLVSNQYATYQKIESTTVEIEDKSESENFKKVAKLLIVLVRSPEFFDNIKKFNELKEANKLANEVSSLPMIVQVNAEWKIVVPIKEELK